MHRVEICLDAADEMITVRGLKHTSIMMRTADMLGLSGIEDSHLTLNATPNNPRVPTGLSNFAYEIPEARVVGGNVLEIDFSVLRDGTPMDLLNLPDDITNSPSFLFAYADGQEGIAAFVEKRAPNFTGQ